MPTARLSIVSLEEFIQLEPESAAAIRVGDRLFMADLPSVVQMRDPVRLIAPIHADARAVEAAALRPSW